MIAWIYRGENIIYKVLSHQKCGDKAISIGEKSIVLGDEIEMKIVI